MFKECTAERYEEMLGVLPPALWLAKGFLVGEPFDHRRCKVTGAIHPSYSALIHYGGKYYEGPNMTGAEFRAFDLSVFT
jgi:hypothetical protein